MMIKMVEGIIIIIMVRKDLYFSNPGLSVVFLIDFTIHFSFNLTIDPKYNPGRHTAVTYAHIMNNLILVYLMDFWYTLLHATPISLSAVKLHNRCMVNDLR